RWSTSGDGLILARVSGGAGTSSGVGRQVPMRKLLSGRSRYGLACLIAAGGLVAATASCVPAKQGPPKEQPPGLSISPTIWFFGDGNEISLNPHSFAVTNNGPSTSGTLETNTGGADPANFQLGQAGTIDNTCDGNTLPAGGTCVVDVDFDPTIGPSGFKKAD